MWAAQAALDLSAFATAAFCDSGEGEISGQVLDAGHHAPFAGVLEFRRLTGKAVADHLNRYQLDTGARILEPGRSVSVSYRRGF